MLRNIVNNNLAVRLWRVARLHYGRVQSVSFVIGALIGLWLLWLRSLPLQLG